MDFLILPPVDNSEEEVGPILSVGVKEERRVSTATVKSPLL